MKTLIVGGTGMIGTHIASHLRKQGNDIVLAARTIPEPGAFAGEFPILQLDYSKDEFSADDLARFDAIVFAAGNDIRHVPKGADMVEFWHRNQSGGVPSFVARAKEAGVSRVVQLGSYYHQLMPDLIATNEYVRARHLADEGARALADSDFNVSTLNPPSIVGLKLGAPAKAFDKLLAWSDGRLPKVPNFAPAGGTNYMSVESLSEAVWGALQNAESGRAYLVGDANLTYRQYFQTIFDAAGSSIQLEERDEEHPLLPDAFIVQGRGNAISYEPDATETATLGYSRGDAERAIRDVVALARKHTPA